MTIEMNLCAFKLFKCNVLIVFSMMFLLCQIGIKLSNSQPQRVKFNKVIVNTNNQSFKIEKDSNKTNQTQQVLIAITVKNNAYSLPTFLVTLETLKCPTMNKKCHLWLVFENCTDQSYEMFTYWLAQTRTKFDTILMIETKNDLSTKEKHPELDRLYFSKNLKLRAIKYAHDKEFNYIFFLNADTILTNPNTIEILIEKKKSIVAPLLSSGESLHSTFTLNFEYDNFNQNEKYKSIYDRKVLGCFKVHGVQESYLMDLNDKNMLKILSNEETFEYEENYDLQISYILDYLNILMHVCNREVYGYVPDKFSNEYDDRVENFISLRMQHLLKGPNKTYNKPLPITQHIEKNHLKKRKTKLGFDQIYVINLERRVDRRERIESALDDLNLSFKMTKAVDALLINEDYLQSLGIRVIPNYKDPYHDRPMNYGEIGCFLSHYFIWKEMVEKNYKKIIIFEDDAKFSPDFKSMLSFFMNEMNQKNLEWDLVYLGRKIMTQYADRETWNFDVSFRKGHGIRRPEFSHWTIAYALSLDGAKKLLNSEPLTKILPIDEYLPLMFDKQPNKYWSSFYPVRNLIAYAIQPSLITPTHYFGEQNYISDTEQTPILNTSKFESPLVQEEVEIQAEEDESTITTTPVRTNIRNEPIYDVDESNQNEYQHVDL